MAYCGVSVWDIAQIPRGGYLVSMRVLCKLAPRIDPLDFCDVDVCLATFNPTNLERFLVRPFKQPFHSSCDGIRAQFRPCKTTLRHIFQKPILDIEWRKDEGVIVAPSAYEMLRGVDDRLRALDVLLPSAHYSYSSDAFVTISSPIRSQEIAFPTFKESSIPLCRLDTSTHKDVVLLPLSDRKGSRTMDVYDRKPLHAD